MGDSRRPGRKQQKQLLLMLHMWCGLLTVTGAFLVGQKMGDPPRPGRKQQKQLLLLLHVWCGLLTVAMAIMGAYVATVEQRSEKDDISTEKSDDENRKDPLFGALKSMSPTGPPLSYIDLTPTLDGESSWSTTLGNQLLLRGSSVVSPRGSVFFIYAQVTFTGGGSGGGGGGGRSDPRSRNSVLLVRNATPTKEKRVLAEARASALAGGSVWLGRTVRLGANDSVYLNVSGHFEKENTFWGAFQLR